MYLLHGFLLQMETEELHKRVAALQKKLDSKNTLELALKVIREFNEDGDLVIKDKRDGAVERKNKTNKDTSHQGLKEKDKYIEQLESLNNILTAKHMESKDEFQEARKVFIKVINTEYIFIMVTVYFENFDLM